MIDFTDDFRAFVEGRFQSEWTILHPTIPIQFDNISFKQPLTGLWVAFTFAQNPSRQVSLGRKMLIRTDGFLQMDVLVHKDKGVAEARRVANSAADIFAFQKFRGTAINATFNEKHVDKAPTSTEFVRVMARVFFIYDGVAIREGVHDIA